MAEKHALNQFGTQNDPQAQNQWYSDNTGDPKRRKIDQKMSKASVDPHNAPVSRVVHARAVPDGCTFQMLLDVLKQFGKISYITMMPRLRQSLVEFERLEDAQKCVQMAASNQFYIKERPIFFNYSTSQEITRSPYGYAPDSNQAPPDEPPPNHILLYTIFKPMYTINVDVIHTISSPYGVVQRIAIFKKNGIQALVEFDSNVSANRAKQNLDGADIYAGCCTLKIEYARTQKVNVVKNDDMTYDMALQDPRWQQSGSSAGLVGQIGPGNLPTSWTQGWSMGAVMGGYGGYYGMNPVPLNATVMNQQVAAQSVPFNPQMIQMNVQQPSVPFPAQYSKPPPNQPATATPVIDES